MLRGPSKGQDRSIDLNLTLYEALDVISDSVLQPPLDTIACHVCCSIREGYLPQLSSKLLLKYSSFYPLHTVDGERAWALCLFMFMPNRQGQPQERPTAVKWTGCLLV